MASTGDRIFSLTRIGGSKGTLSPSHQSTCSHEGGAHGAAQYHLQRQRPLRSGRAAHRVLHRHRERQSRGAGINETRYGSSHRTCHHWSFSSNINYCFWIAERSDWRCLLSNTCPSCHRRETADFEAASTARHGSTAAGGEAA